MKKILPLLVVILVAVVLLPASAFAVGGQGLAESGDDSKLAAQGLTADGGSKELAEPKIVESGTCGTCTWTIDAKDNLVVRPTNGKEGTLDKWKPARYGADESIVSYSPWSETSIKTVRFEGTVRAQTCSGMFAVCRNLRSADLTGLDTSQVKDTSFMFRLCVSLKSIDFTGVDTSKVKDMSEMFARCTSLKSLDLSGFNTSRVTTMGYMFDGCGSLASLDISGFNTSRVEYVRGMFNSCRSLTSLDVSSFDTSKMSGMHEMFAYCSSLSSLDLSNFDTSNVEAMYHMFNGCSGLDSLDLSSFDTSNVMSMNYMFAGCSSLTYLNLSSFDMSKTPGISAMFSGCSSLKTIAVSDLWSLDVSNLDIPAGGSIDSYGENMFKDCVSLVGGNGTTYDENHTSWERAHIDVEGDPGYLTRFVEDKDKDAGDTSSGKKAGASSAATAKTGTTPTTTAKTGDALPPISLTFIVMALASGALTAFAFRRIVKSR